jgi:EmrB/QacA subfamily drug resistance transporter
LQWVLNAYTLTLAAFILLGGSLGDRLGRRRVFVVGAVWFAVASLLCGLAPSTGLLIVARGLEGVGGALLTPASLALIQASFAPADRAKAIGTWSGFASVTAALGPLLGGWLVDALSWRWVFFINLPLALIVVLVALRHVPESRDPSATGSFDVTGASLGVLALAGISYALIEAPNVGASSPVVLTTAVVGVAAAAGFVVVERRARQPMLPPDMFASPQFTAANLVTFMVYGAFGGLSLFLILQLQTVAGFSALVAGSAFLPVTALMLLLSPVAGAVAERIGPRRPMTAGPLVAAGGVALLSGVGAGASYLTDVLPGVGLFGLGLAITVAPLTATVLGAAPARHSGLASGVNNAVARSGGLIVVAVLPLVVGLSGADYQNAAAFTEPYRVAMLICAGLLAVGGVLAWWRIRDVVPEEVPAEPAEARLAPACHVHCAVGAPPLDPGTAPRHRQPG